MYRPDLLSAKAVSLLTADEYTCVVASLSCLRPKGARPLTTFQCATGQDSVIPASIATNPSMKRCVFIVRAAVSARHWHMCVEWHLGPWVHHIKRAAQVQCRYGLHRTEFVHCMVLFYKYIATPMDVYCSLPTFVYVSQREVFANRCHVRVDWTSNVMH